MSDIKIYENVEGLHIDVPITDNEGEQVTNDIILSSKFFVLRPGDTDEEEWATSLVAPNILRHTVPEDADLHPGRYILQPYIETVDGYKGRCESVKFRIRRSFS